MESASNHRFVPLILSGASGAGKGTIVKKLLADYPNLFELSISLTTRNPRAGQQHGREYYFVSHDQFRKQIEQGVFAEYCEVHGNYYGTHKQKLREIIGRGHIALLDIDIQGAEKIKANFKEADSNCLWLDTPSFQILEARLRGRGTDSEEAIQKRMKNAVKEIEESKRVGFYSRIVNDNLEQTYREVLEFLKTKYSSAPL